MMKREYVNQENFSSSGSSSSAEKGKMRKCEPEETGIDELFEVLGYNVKSSDMVDVAHKIHQIEAAMGNQGGLSQLAALDTVHYNPSDLSSWLEYMLSGLSPLPEFELDPFLESSAIDSSNSSGGSGGCSGITAVDLDFGSDLIAIPGKAVFPDQPPAKKAKTSPEFSPPRSLLIDSQENGIRLVHTLMLCAEAVHQENFKLADALVQNIRFLAVSQAGAMRKVATYFAEALARRIYRDYYPIMTPHDPAFTDMLQMHFYETCPYFKFAHFTANQAILEAFAGKTRVHVIDFSMKQGMQWPALLQALALRQGGAPTFRLTGIGPNTEEVGFRLGQFAKTINVKFEYRGIAANSLSDLDASLLDIRDGETLAVNSIFELHRLLAKPGEIEKVLRVIREVKPEILTVVEQEANHNGNSFLDRFTESLHYYSSLFDSLESCDGGDNQTAAISRKNKMMSEAYLGHQILNVVACEGGDRIERHESLTRWGNRLVSTGFEAVHLGSNVYNQAIMLLAVFGGDGYSVVENNGCLLLGWHTRPLIATSAWTTSRSRPPPRTTTTAAVSVAGI